MGLRISSNRLLRAVFTIVKCRGDVALHTNAEYWLYGFYGEVMLLIQISLVHILLELLTVLLLYFLDAWLSMTASFKDMLRLALEIEAEERDIADEVAWGDVLIKIAEGADFLYTVEGRAIMSEKFIRKGKRKRSRGLVFQRSTQRKSHPSKTRRQQHAYTDRNATETKEAK